jgi:hypothetical protein
MEASNKFIQKIGPYLGEFIKTWMGVDKTDAVMIITEDTGTFRVSVMSPATAKAVLQDSWKGECAHVTWCAEKMQEPPGDGRFWLFGALDGDNNESMLGVILIRWKDYLKKTAN